MLRILEVSWLVVFLFGLGFALYKGLTEGLAGSVYILIFTIIPLALYLIRRKQRIMMEKQKETKAD